MAILMLSAIGAVAEFELTRSVLAASRRTSLSPAPSGADRHTSCSQLSGEVYFVHAERRSDFCERQPACIEFRGLLPLGAG